MTPTGKEAIVGYQLSCADYSWPLLDHRAALRLMRDIEMDAVDVGLFYGVTHIKPEQVVVNPLRWAGVVAERVEAAGLEVADVFLTPGPDLVTRTPNHLEPAQRQAGREMMQAVAVFAEALGAPGVTALPGVVFEEEGYEQAIERSAEELAVWVEIAGERGLGMSIEPHNGGCCDTPERTATLLEATPGLTITIDPSHFAYAGFDVEQMLPLLSRTRHVQFRPGSEGVMQSRVAENQIDFGALLSALADHGYDGYVAMEFVWIDAWDCNRVDNLSETILLRDLVRSLS